MMGFTRHYPIILPSLLPHSPGPIVEIAKGGFLMICSLSSEKNIDLDKIKAAEKELGVTLLAFSCHDISAATVDAEALKKIQALEQELGVSLVAVKG